MDGPLDKDQRRRVRERLPAAGVATDDTKGRTSVTAPVEASTLRQAVDTGLRQVREATGAQAVALYVQTEQDRQADLIQPTVPELVSLTEIGKMLDVTKQRAGQLAARADFPPPVVRLASGPLYAKAAVEQFVKTWTRKTGRPKTKKDGT